MFQLLLSFQVGGGSAGSVVASRLSEDLGVSLSLVLEAGEDDDNFPKTKVPLENSNLRNTEIDWAYRTVPQEKACKSMEENVSFVTQQ